MRVNVLRQMYLEKKTHFKKNISIRLFFSTNLEETHYSITAAEHLDPANGTCSA